MPDYAPFNYNGIRFAPRIDEHGWLRFECSDVDDETGRIYATPFVLKASGARIAMETPSAAPERFIVDPATGFITNG